jgi:hypothetical protein
MATMKVTSQDLSQLGAAGASQTYETPSGASGFHPSSQKGSDRVDFSSTLSSLSRAMTADGSSRDFKVQTLTAQYQSGSFSPNSTAVASGMVSEALGM